MSGTEISNTSIWSSLKDKIMKSTMLKILDGKIIKLFWLT